MQHNRSLQMITITVVILFFTFQAASYTEAQVSDLAIEIRINNGSTLHFPVQHYAAPRHSFAVIPLDGERAVRVVPLFKDGKVAYDVTLLSDGWKEVKTCGERYDLKGESLGRYIGSKGQINTIDRDNFTVHIQVTARRPDEMVKRISVHKSGNSLQGEIGGGGEVFCGCAKCQSDPNSGTTGTLQCCPDPGRCLDCGTCGLVCCQKSGF